jgi:hypothetical protein
VFEHLLDPCGVLARIHSALRPGGRLYVRAPDTAPLVRLGRHVAPRWNFFHVPWHLQIAGPSRMGRLLHESGFTVRRLTPPLPGLTYDLMARVR